MWRRKAVKYVEIDKSGTDCRLSQKSLSSVQKCDLKKLSLTKTSDEPLYDPYSEEFVVVVSLMFVRLAISEELRQTDTQKHRQNCALYIRLI